MRQREAPDYTKPQMTPQYLSTPSFFFSPGRVNSDHRHLNITTPTLDDIITEHRIYLYTCTLRIHHIGKSVHIREHSEAVLVAGTTIGSYRTPQRQATKYSGLAANSTDSHHTLAYVYKAMLGTSLTSGPKQIWTGCDRFLM